MAYPFKLPELGYSYDALEPHIDARTMEIHHTKHHLTYTNNVNAALEGNPDVHGQEAEDLIRNLNELPEGIRMAVRNNGGGFINHNLFWNIMKPGGSNRPAGSVGQAIDRAFGSFDAFRDKFSDAAVKRFGSGWAWLIVAGGGDVQITSTPNQDSPLMERMRPVLGLDVWEHAYYLKYQNRRPDYIQAWWNLVNWDEVDRLYEQARG